MAKSAIFLRRWTPKTYQTGPNSVYLVSGGWFDCVEGLRIMNRNSPSRVASGGVLFATKLPGFRPRLMHIIAFLAFAVALAACGNDTPPVTADGGLDSCVTDPVVCNADDLCRLAVFEEDNIKRWNDDNLRWQPYVREAQSRGLSCGL